MTNNWNWKLSLLVSKTSSIIVKRSIDTDSAIVYDKIKMK